MSDDNQSARAQILGSVTRSLSNAGLRDKAAVEARMAAKASNLIPARSKGLDREGLSNLFVAKAEEAAASVDRVASLADVPEAVSRYLASNNLPSRIIQAPAFQMEGVDWSHLPALEVKTGTPDGSEDTSLTPVLAAVAETATLMLTSDKTTPTGLNFLPENHVAVVYRSQIVGPLEEAWARLQEQSSEMPRTVNLITGPSRTGDIEQKIQMGAHGPRRLHIILIED